MDPGSAGAHQLGRTELRRPGDAEVELGALVAAEGFHRRGQLLRDRRLAELAEAHDLGVAGDRHHPGDDRHVDPGRAGRGDEVEVVAVVEEELGDQKAGAGVDLGLQVGEVGLEAGGSGMDLGEAGAADREVPVLAR